MKTLSSADFKALVARNDWSRDQDICPIDVVLTPREEWSDDNETVVVTENRKYWGCATKTSTLDGITITYSEGYDYVEYQTDSLSTGTEGHDETWTIDGVSVVDEDGDVMSVVDLVDDLSSDFSLIDYAGLQIEKTTDVGEVDEVSGMEIFTVEIDYAPSLRFAGEVLGHAASSDNNAMGSSYSGTTGRWSELTLYKTIGGKFVCHQVGHTRWDGERTRYTGKVCETVAEVVEFFGQRWLAKELYADAEIDNVIDVD